MGFFDMFDKLDDCVQTIVDATFGWSNTLQKKHLEKVKTKNEKDILETKARIEEEGKKLESERKEREKKIQLEFEKEQNDERKRLLKAEQEIYEQDISFKVEQVKKLTEIVSGLQNEHSKKVMLLLTEYKESQISIIKDLKDSSNQNIKNIAEEAKEYKESFPEIYTLKLEQIKVELTNHQKLLGELTDGMTEDLRNIQNWLLDASKFNAEDFILKISGSTEEAKNFSRFLENKQINPDALEIELKDEINT